MRYQRLKKEKLKKFQTGDTVTIPESTDSTTYADWVIGQKNLIKQMQFNKAFIDSSQAYYNNLEQKNKSLLSQYPDKQIQKWADITSQAYNEQPTIQTATGFEGKSHEEAQTLLKDEKELKESFGEDGSWTYVYDETMAKDDSRNLGNTKGDGFEGYRVGYRHTDPAYFNIESDPERIKAITEGKKELGYNWEGEEYDAEADRIGTGRHAHSVKELLQRNVNDLRDNWTGWPFYGTGRGGSPPRYEPDSPFYNAYETIMQSQDVNTLGSLLNIVWSPFSYAGNAIHNLAGDVGGSISEGIFNTDSEGRLGRNPTYIDQFTGEEKEGWNTDRILNGLYNAVTGTFPDRGLEEELYGADAKLENTESRRVPHSKKEGWINPYATKEPAEENIDHVAHATSFFIPGAAMHAGSRVLMQVLSAPFAATKAISKLPKNIHTIEDIINYAKANKNISNADKTAIGDAMKASYVRAGKAGEKKGDFQFADAIWKEVGFPNEAAVLKGREFYDLAAKLHHSKYEPAIDAIKKWNQGNKYILNRPKAPMSSEIEWIDKLGKWGEKDLWGTGWLRNLRNRFKREPAVEKEWSPNYEFTHYPDFTYPAGFTEYALPASKHSTALMNVKQPPPSINENPMWWKRYFDNKKDGGNILPKAQWGKIVKYLKDQPKGKPLSQEVLKVLEGWKDALKTDIANISLPGVREAMEQIDRSVAPGSLDYYNQAVEYIKGTTPVEYKINVDAKGNRTDLLTDADRKILKDIRNLGYSAETGRFGSPGPPEHAVPLVLRNYEEKPVKNLTSDIANIDNLEYIRDYLSADQFTQATKGVISKEELPLRKEAMEMVADAYEGKTTFPVAEGFHDVQAANVREAEEAVAADPYGFEESYLEDTGELGGAGYDIINTENLTSGVQLDASHLGPALQHMSIGNNATDPGALTMFRDLVGTDYVPGQPEEYYLGSLAANSPVSVEVAEPAVSTELPDLGAEYLNVGIQGPIHADLGARPENTWSQSLYDLVQENDPRLMGGYQDISDMYKSDIELIKSTGQNTNPIKQFLTAKTEVKKLPAGERYYGSDNISQDAQNYEHRLYMWMLKTGLGKNQKYIGHMPINRLGYAEALEAELKLREVKTNNKEINDYLKSIGEPIIPEPYILPKTINGEQRYIIMKPQTRGTRTEKRKWGGALPKFQGVDESEVKVVNPWQTVGAQHPTDKRFHHSTIPGSTRWVSEEGKTPFQVLLETEKLTGGYWNPTDTMLQNTPIRFDLNDLATWGSTKSRDINQGQRAEAFNKTYGIPSPTSTDPLDKLRIAINQANYRGSDKFIPATGERGTASRVKAGRAATTEEEAKLRYYSKAKERDGGSIPSFQNAGETYTDWNNYLAALNVDNSSLQMIDQGDFNALKMTDDETSAFNQKFWNQSGSGNTGQFSQATGFNPAKDPKAQSFMAQYPTNDDSNSFIPQRIVNGKNVPLTNADPYNYRAPMEDASGTQISDVKQNLWKGQPMDLTDEKMGMERAESAYRQSNPLDTWDTLSEKQKRKRRNKEGRQERRENNPNRMSAADWVGLGVGAVGQWSKVREQDRQREEIELHTNYADNVFETDYTVDFGNKVTNLETDDPYRKGSPIQRLVEAGGEIIDVDEDILRELIAAGAGIEIL